MTMQFYRLKIKDIRFFLIITILFSTFAMQALPPQPRPARLVNDFENFLSPAQASALENKLSEFDRTHQTQIAVIITNSLYGFEIADFSTRIGTEWGIGRAGFENGVVITVAPVNRDVFIAVGYGLEGVIPDITARRIVENEILPAFHQGNYYQGIDNAVNVIMQLASGEFPAGEYAAGQEEVPGEAILVSFLMVILLVVFLSRRSRHYSSPGKSIPFWSLFWLMSHRNSGSRGSFGNFSSGRGSFGAGGGSFGGGRGGSSFGGFGGGRFGGGGAGGSW